VKWALVASWRERRTVFVEAATAEEAQAKARNGEWDEAGDDETTGPFKVRVGKARPVHDPAPKVKKATGKDLTRPKGRT
jgi:hypothetical protein